MARKFKQRKEINLEGDIGFRTIRIIQADSGTIKDHGGKCSKAEFFISMCIIGQGSSLTHLLELLDNCDLMQRLFELDKEVSFVAEILAELWMLLMPALWPCGGVVREKDSNIRIQKFLSQLNCLILVCALQIHCNSLFLHMLAKDPILATLKRCDT